MIRLHASAPERTPVDLIIADYRLATGTTGLEAIADLFNHLTYTVPAFLLTGDTSPSVLKQIAESGLQMLNKPVDGDALQAAIDKAVHRNMPQSLS